MIGNHHSNVHQGLEEAVRLYSSGKEKEAVERLRDVEVSSEEAFEELIESVVKAQS